MDSSTKKIIAVARIIFFAIFIFLCALVLIFEANNDNLSYSRSVQVTEIDICNISYSEEGIPERVTVCGYLDMAGSIAELSIKLYQMPDEKLISENPHSDSLFEAGFFSRELSLEGTSGSYLVEIMLYREVISSMRFDVNNLP